MSARLARFIDIGSGIDVEDDVLRYSISSSWTYTLTQGIKVYLVSEEMIDSLCPPERRRGVPLEKADEVKRIIAEELLLDKFRDLDELLEVIDKRFAREYTALGCFLPPSTRLASREMKPPAILVCPERVADASKTIAAKLDVSEERVFRMLFRAVLSHEEAHALIWRLGGDTAVRAYSGFYGRVLEEAYAQLAAYTNRPPSDPEAYSIAFTLMSRLQPLEYNAWTPLQAIIGADSLDVSVAILKYTLLLAGGGAPEEAAKAYFMLALLLVYKPAAISFDVLFYPTLHIRGFLNYLHRLSRQLGIGAHEYYHRVLEPMLLKAGEDTTVLVKIAAVELLYLTSFMVSNVA